ncbi:MAG TPA: tetratricopeptide repeat protein, partial [Terracidiphilus sp.]
MRKTSLLTAVILAAAISGAPQLAAAMGSSNPAPPSDTSKPSGKGQTKKNKKDKSSSAKEFLDRYHAAYALIYDKEDYQSGITALRAIGYDDNADVATLLGYASRKLGRYDDAKYWYDKALAADPNHAVTWSYYG